MVETLINMAQIFASSEFATNIAKFNIDPSICDFGKDWLKFIKWAIWINPDCSRLKFFKNISSSKKELILMKKYVKLWKNNMIQFLFYFDLSLLYVLGIRIGQCFLNERYRSNHTVRDYCFLKSFETEKKNHKPLTKTW